MAKIRAAMEMQGRDKHCGGIAKGRIGNALKRDAEALLRRAKTCCGFAVNGLAREQQRNELKEEVFE